MSGAPLPVDAHSDAVDRWGAALEQGDDDEVDRLVRQSRLDRKVGARSGRLGDGGAPTPSRVRERGGGPSREIATVAGLPAEGVVVLAPGTAWQVPWELMMLGPFVSCGVRDGEIIRHVTVPSMVASAVRRGSTPRAALALCDYRPLPVFAADTRLLAAAASVVEAGWDLAVVMAREPRFITARSVYRALVGSDAVGASTASLIRSGVLTGSAPSWSSRRSELGCAGGVL